MAAALLGEGRGRVPRRDGALVYSASPTAEDDRELGASYPEVLVLRWFWPFLRVVSSSAEARGGGREKEEEEKGRGDGSRGERGERGQEAANVAGLAVVEGEGRASKKKEGGARRARKTAEGGGGGGEEEEAGPRAVRSIGRAVHRAHAIIEKAQGRAACDSFTEEEVHKAQAERGEVRRVQQREAWKDSHEEVHGVGQGAGGGRRSKKAAERARKER